MKKFPLISGNLSVDLVNTEVVRRGQRYDLLITDEDMWDWLNTVQEQIPFWNDRNQLECQNRMTAVKETILKMRIVLREQFELIADNHEISSTFVIYLEKCIERAPITYKIIGQQLVIIPLGEIEEMLITLIAFDALTLIANQKLCSLKRCSNADCVLLFIDESGRRKWCSMKICGNRQKVAKFQHRKSEET